MERSVIGVDIAKNVFQVAVSTTPGRVDLERRLTRRKFFEWLANREPSVVVLEACGAAHHVGRKCREMGHEPVLLPPDRAKPYVVGNKTDRADTVGILEAYRNEKIRPVP